jgi:signal peptidase I
MIKKEKLMNLKRILISIKNLLIIVIAAILIKSFILETSKIPTGSMEKTILVGDFLFVNKFIYGSSSPRNIPYTDIRLPYFKVPGIREPERFDIVVFDYPGDRDALISTTVMSYVKRLIALPGDTLEIKNQVVFVNGKEIWIPPYVQYKKQMPIPAGFSMPYIFPRNSGWNEDNYGPLVIPKKGNIVNLTLDNIETYRTLINRHYGRNVVTIYGDKIKIDGEIAETFTIPQDFYFMMGDNRDDSADSRFWGFVPRENIVGQAWMIYWSWPQEIPFSDPIGLFNSIRWSRIGRVVN